MGATFRATLLEDDFAASAASAAAVNRGKDDGEGHRRIQLGTFSTVTSGGYCLYNSPRGRFCCLCCRRCCRQSLPSLGVNDESIYPRALDGIVYNSKSKQPLRRMQWEDRLQSHIMSPIRGSIKSIPERGCFLFRPLHTHPCYPFGADSPNLRYTPQCLYFKCKSMLGLLYKKHTLYHGLSVHPVTWYQVLL